MKAGRHRTFDKDIALDKAMEVFWRNGYRGTSLTDLTQAMGINKPSLYSAFGNKESLYKCSLELYVEKYGNVHAQHLFVADKNMSERIRGYLTSIAQMLTTAKLPGGCFVCISTCEVGGDCLPADAVDAITTINKLTKLSLVDFFNAAKQKGELSNERSPIMMANYLLSLQFGLAVMARNGANFDELDEVIRFSTSNF